MSDLISLVSRVWPIGCRKKNEIEKNVQYSLTQYLHISDEMITKYLFTSLFTSVYTFWYIPETDNAQIDCVCWVWSPYMRVAEIEGML